MPIPNPSSAKGFRIKWAGLRKYPSGDVSFIAIWWFRVFINSSPAWFKCNCGTARFMIARCVKTPRDVAPRLSPMPQQNAESNFRSNLSQFRWAQGNTNDSQQQQPSGNPFSRFYNSVAGDYVPLRSNDRSNEEEAWFALSRWER